MLLLTDKEPSRLEKGGVEVIFPKLKGNQLHYPRYPAGDKTLAVVSYETELVTEFEGNHVAYATAVAYIVWFRGQEIGTFRARTGSWGNACDRLFSGWFRRRALERAMNTLGI